MLRYLYLLCILIAINCIHCYDYTDQKAHKHDRRLVKKNRFHKSRFGDKHHIGRNSQEFKIVEDKEPKAQIDVASFIQKPDEYAVDNQFLYGTDTKKSEKNLNSYSDEASLVFDSKEDIVKRSNKRLFRPTAATDKPLDLGRNPFAYKDTTRRLNLDSLSLHGLNNGKIAWNLAGKMSTSTYERALYDSDSNIVHNPQKKCALKEMIKLPFFSHNKSEVAKPKRAKKRKLFCFNCANKKEKENRSNELSLVAHDFKEMPRKEDNAESLSELSKMNTVENEEELNLDQVKRDKREEWLEDRARQIKELEEIQKKVDSVEIIPSYGKLPEQSK